ncbi:MAG: hotdog fold thioesterase, partial [Bacteroidota bacterium]
ELNCSHLRSATKGFVTGTVKPIRIGRKLQVWEIKIRDEKEKMICVSRLTIMVLDL